MYFVILPIHLYNTKYLEEFRENKFIIWEHPHYFTSYKYNKKKIILHRASMKYYYDYLKLNKYKIIKYIDFNEEFDSKMKYFVFDPVDKIKLPGDHIIIESPNFILTKKIYSQYRKKTNKFFFNAFYMWCKKKSNILPDIKSQDKFNRKKLPKDFPIPDISNSNIIDNTQEKYVKDAIKYVNKYFSENYGNTNDFIYPITHKSSKYWLNNFIEMRMKFFGPYQDSLSNRNNYLFHSVLSSSINIGLINPLNIINIILKKKEIYNIGLESLEGFIRQLFWREYQRYCYIYFNFNKKNYFKNNNKLTDKWYKANLNIEPVDYCIKKAFNIGYLHHIERLMIIGNYMNLSRISPRDGFRWFMEFSIDSYLWVMHQNVYDMVFFVSGGITMRRPYISSSNYILKMSDYKKSDWCNIWDKKYYKFITDNKDKLWKFRYYFRTIQ